MFLSMKCHNMTYHCSAFIIPQIYLQSELQTKGTIAHLVKIVSNIGINKMNVGVANWIRDTIHRFK